jgi:hypothetical protein
MLVTALSVLPCACLDDAPRDNPLDPDAGRFAPIYGHVMSLFPPHRLLSGVVVSAPSCGLIDSSGSDGSFALLYAPPESTWIITSSAEFQPCTLLVPLERHAREHVEIFLNALPEVLYATVTSTHRQTWWPDPYEEWITLDARVEDPDGMGDVDSVRCAVPGGLTVTLVPEMAPGTFRATLDNDLQYPFNAEDYVGENFVFTAFDKQGAPSSGRTVRLVRVVRDVGVPTAPWDMAEVGPNPTLRWVPPDPFYPSVLRAKVTRIDSGVETTAWQSPLLPPLTDSTTVSVTLSAGTYYWAVQTIDSFGNVGQSGDAGFRVVQ